MLRFVLRPCRAPLAMAQAGRRYAAVATGAPQFTHTDLFQTAAPDGDTWWPSSAHTSAVVSSSSSVWMYVKSLISPLAPSSTQSLTAWQGVHSSKSQELRKGTTPQQHASAPRHVP